MIAVSGFQFRAAGWTAGRAGRDAATAADGIPIFSSLDTMSVTLNTSNVNVTFRQVAIETTDSGANKTVTTFADWKAASPLSP